VLLPDGSFFIGDEYGPYLYRFSPTGRMLAAVRPPNAFLPIRKGEVHHSSDNPGPGAQAPEPRNPETGRQNNQGSKGSVDARRPPLSSPAEDPQDALPGNPPDTRCSITISPICGARARARELPMFENPT
jgi:hypothetical protein